MNRPFVSFAWATASVLSLSACGHEASVDTAAIVDELTRSSHEIATAFNAGDIDTIVAKFAPDAVALPPDSEPARGTEAIRKLWSEASASNRSAGISVTLGDDLVRASGEIAWHSGSFAFKDAAGQDVPGGHYLEAWENRDGKWLIVRMIWNADHPPQETPPAEPPAEAPPAA